MPHTPEYFAYDSPYHRLLLRRARRAERYRAALQQVSITLFRLRTDPDDVDALDISAAYAVVVDALHGKANAAAPGEGRP